MSLDEIVASPSDAEAADKEEIETEEIPQTEKTGELATDADAEEASPSDADEELLDGQIYEPALLGDDAVVAFVTTAAEMLLDEEDYPGVPGRRRGSCGRSGRRRSSRGCGADREGVGERGSRYR